MHSCHPDRHAYRRTPQLHFAGSREGAFTAGVSRASKGDELLSYSDSDLSGNFDLTTKSQTGTMVMLNNVPVFWRSKKQCDTSDSRSILVAEAEIYALSHTVADARDLCWRLSDANEQNNDYRAVRLVQSARAKVPA